jgi:hypothetical protein
VAAAHAAAGLAALAVLGRGHLPGAWRRPAVAVAVLGLGLAVASGVPGVRSAWDLLVDLPVGAPLREGQRFLVLWLVVALPAAAHGADRLARRVAPAAATTATALPLVAGLVLAAPAALGAEGAFEPRPLPASWTRAAEVVDERPGTTLVLPWHLYYTAAIADGRNILNPGPDLLGGDTISSYDPGIGGGQEQLDTRWEEADRILAGYRRGEPGAERLAALGVRWVFLPKEYDWPLAGDAIAEDPGLRPVPVGEGLLLYEVRGWAGPLRTPAGGGAEVGGPITPLRTAPSSGGTWAFPGTAGWLRGVEPVEVTDLGLLEVPSGDGPLWYWPALPIVLGDLAALAGVAWAVRRRDGRSRQAGVRS